MKDSDRRRLLKFLLAGSVAYPATSSALWFFNDDKEIKPIHRWSGSIKINGHTLQPTSMIKPGDTVETGDDSEIVFTQGKDAYLLRSNTRIILNNNGVIDILRLLSGAMLSVLDRARRRSILLPRSLAYVVLARILRLPSEKPICVPAMERLKSPLMTTPQ